MSAAVSGNRPLVMCMVLAVIACTVPRAGAEQVKLDVALGTPVMLQGQKQTTYIRVAMTGFKLDNEDARPAANVAIVLDKSGSMRGDKINRAKAAAIRAVSRLRSDDIVSIVAYDETVQVLVPATRASDRDAIRAGIERLQAGGSTALFAGVSKGAAEVKKFLDEDRVNRVILLSDGLANVGPCSPGDLAELGTSLRQEGIAVSTIGLGLDYNEDLMTGLAQKSDGNHMFAENAVDLDRAFEREFGDVLTVVAQEVGVVIRCADGIRPVRVIGREADIVGQTVTTSLNQIYSEQMKYVILEVEIPVGNKGDERKVAQVDVSYANMATKTTDRLRSTVAVAFTDSPAEVEKGTNADVMASAIRQIGAERNVFAMRLRDEGKIEEAQQVLTSNGKFLEDNALRYNSEALKNDAYSNISDVFYTAPERWKQGRKQMQEYQHNVYNQQAQQ